MFEDNLSLLVRNYFAKGNYSSDFLRMKENKDYKTLRVVFQVDIHHCLCEVKWFLISSKVSLSVIQIISVLSSISLLYPNQLSYSFTNCENPLFQPNFK